MSDAEKKAAAWHALPAPVRADLREWLSSPMVDPARGVTLIQGGVVTWGRDYRRNGLGGARADRVAPRRPPRVPALDSETD